MTMGRKHGAAPRDRHPDTSIAITAGPGTRPGARMPAMAASVLAAPAFAALLGLGAAALPLAAQAEPNHPPVTYDAGMGTADAPRLAAPRAGGIDAAGDGEAMLPAGTAASGAAMPATATAADPAIAQPASALAAARADASEPASIQTPAIPPATAAAGAAPATSELARAGTPDAGPHPATATAPAEAMPLPSHATVPAVSEPAHARIPAAEPAPAHTSAPTAPSAPSHTIAPVVSEPVRASVPATPPAGTAPHAAAPAAAAHTSAPAGATPAPAHTPAPTAPEPVRASVPAATPAGTAPHAAAPAAAAHTSAPAGATPAPAHTPAPTAPEPVRASVPAATPAGTAPHAAAPAAAAHTSAPAGAAPAPAHTSAPIAPEPTRASAPIATTAAQPSAAPVMPEPAPTSAPAAAPKAADTPAAAPDAAAATPAQAEAGTPEPQAAEAPAPLPPLAQALADLLAQPVAGGTRKEQEGLVAWYGEHQHTPVFVDDRGITARGTAVLARLGAAAEDGLDPVDYAVARPAATDPASLARAELKIAQAALAYARHAQSGRFEPSRISALVTPVREIPDPAAILDTLATAADANAALAGFNPPHAGYKALKAQLAGGGGERSARPAVVVPIASGPVLKPGNRDARVPALRTRFGLTRPAGDDTLYDPALVAAVEAFQEASGLTPDGIIGPATLAAANRGVGAPATGSKADIIANMERWRWLPRDLGDAYVMVNIPEYLVRIVKDGRPIHETRVVVGKPETPTPLLTRDMQYVVVNPAWNIPPSIARNEMMPLYRSDPSALARRGIQVVHSRGGGVSFRQAPGERNALGRIKFMFPNDHAVYLHDTPSRSLFSNPRRAYSHGCVRVNEPLKFGEVIFNLGLPGDGWSQGRIGKMFGASERYINLKQRFPVHIVYFTTFVDETGRLVSREDLYGINARVKAQLDLNGRQRLATR